jgi:RHS repeat-associated protein
MRGLYERATGQAHGANTEHTYRILVAGREIAQVARQEASGSIVDEQTTYLHANAPGSPELLTDRDGDEVARRSFDPFGDLESGSFGNVRVGFTGHEHDQDVELIDMLGRAYDPKLGLFLSIDPALLSNISGQGLTEYRKRIGMAGDNGALPYDEGAFDFGVLAGERSNYARVLSTPRGIQGPNDTQAASPSLQPEAMGVYSYGNNNPLVLVDPDGRNPIAIVAVALIAASISGDTPEEGSGSKEMFVAGAYLLGARALFRGSIKPPAPILEERCAMEGLPGMGASTVRTKYRRHSEGD